MVFIDKRNATGSVSIEGSSNADLLLGGRFDDGIYGGDGNDTARGGDGNDFIVDWSLHGFSSLLNGEGGDDSFAGEDGDDTLQGGDGNDTLDGGADNDEILGEAGDDTLIGGDGDDLLTETIFLDRGGNDSLDGGAGFDILRAGRGDDTLDGGSDNDILNGGTGADRLHGGSGKDVLDGGDLPANQYDALVAAGFMTQAAADALIDQLNAGDTASFNLLRAVDVDLERAVQIGGDAEGDTLTGIENLVGTIRADVLRGDDKSNILEGGAGSDMLEGRGGADVLDGGTGGLSGDPGIDTVTYASSDAAVNIDLIRATQLGGDAQGDTLISIENVTGSRFGDQLRGDDLDNFFDASFGNDVIDGRGGTDTIDLKAWDVGLGLSARSVAVTLSDLGDGTARRTDFFQLAETDTLRGIENVLGTNVRDTITGNGANNLLEGRAGSDTLEGRGGADVLNGGTGGTGGDPGLDTASYESSAAAVNIDLIRATQTGGDAQGDTLVSIENLIGSRFGDQLRGDDTNNRFDGGLGNDVIDGRGGTDTLDLSAWDVAMGFIVPQVSVTLRDTSDGTATRADFVGFQNGGFRVTETDTLRGIENVLGTNVRDTITGNGANNLLDGRAGNDVLSGGGGADTITGGLGADDMTGGTGADVFDFNAFDEISTANASTFDIIRDFQSGVDKIDLRDLGDLTAVGSFQGIAGQVVFNNGSLGGVDMPVLVIDINGDNIADRAVFVQTSGAFPLNSDLFIL